MIFQGVFLTFRELGSHFLQGSGVNGDLDDSLFYLFLLKKRAKRKREGWGEKKNTFHPLPPAFCPLFGEFGEKGWDLAPRRTFL